MNPRVIRRNVVWSVVAAAFAILVASCAGTGSVVGAQGAASAESAEEQTVLQIIYDGHRDARGTLVQDANRSALTVRYLLDGLFLGEHNVGARIRLAARLSAGQHRLTIQGSETGSEKALFSNVYEMVIGGGAQASVSAASRDYFTGKTRKNLMMQRWDKEMTLAYGVYSSDGFESFRQVEGSEGEGVFRTMWVQE